MTDQPSQPSQPPQPSDQPPPSQPAPPPLIPQFENDPCSVLQDMLEMLGFEATVTATELEDGVVLHVSTPEAGRLIGRQGQHLQDLKLLLSRMMQKQYPDIPRKVMVDVEHYLEKQNEELIQRANEAADRVKRWGDPVELPAMNAYDRRIVHQTLANDTEVETESVEEGRQSSKKCVIVRLRQQPASPPNKS